MRRIFKNIDKRLFVFIFLLSIVSSSFTFLGEMDFDGGGLFWVICLAGMFSYFMCIVSAIIYNWKTLQKIYNFICASLIFSLIATEAFLWYYFQMIFNENIFSIIEGTNINESIGFLNTYIKGLVIIVASVGVITLGLYFISRLLAKFPNIINAVIAISLVFSIAKVSLSVYSSVVYRFGGHLAAYSTWSRLGRSAFLHYKFMLETERLIDNLETKSIQPSTAKCDKVVVIIGESYSKYHSQLYGYERETTPLLSALKDKGELYVFSDVITSINDTERAFRSIYSLGEVNDMQYSDYMLFPYAFRLADFYTINIDNMDLARQTSRVKDSKKLSDLMFDFRNTTTCQYDEEIFRLYPADIENSRQLYVIKLKGQHYTYADTFPETFNIFNAEQDYNDLNLSLAAKQIVSAYDNSTLYNDYVVNAIIEKFKDDNAVIIYFSDHGEEVYDARNYMGHGGTSPFLHYQIEIPFMIWMSDMYKESNPNVLKNIIDNIDKPYTTDYVAHTILDLAGLNCSQFVPQRSIVNDSFMPVKKRVVNYSLVYEYDVMPNKGN